MRKKMVVLFLLAALAWAVSSGVAEVYTCVVHRGEYVWVRESPEPNGRKIGRVRYGYEVEPEQEHGNYYRIRLQPGWMLEGETASHGWVDRSYFELPIRETTYTVVSHGPLAKRETPEGRLLCWVKSGARISVFGWRYSKSGELWAKVFKGGYCKAEYLELR